MYCQKGECPTGFSEGSVFWDDENFHNQNKVGGERVDGKFGKNTKIYYCCGSDGHPHNEIILPTDKPFFLIRKHEDGCQEVNGMEVQELRIDTDDENFKTRISSQVMLPLGVKKEVKSITATTLIWNCRDLDG